MTNPLAVSAEFGEYFEQHSENFYLLEHDKQKKIIQMQYVRDEIDFEIKYSGEEPHITFQVKIDRKEYEQLVKRTEVVWRTTPPKSFEECLDQLNQFFRDHKRVLREMNSKEYIEKQLALKLDEKFKEICEKEGNTIFSFNRDVGYANLKRDIIDAHFKADEYGFRIEPINGNPYHWKVQFFGFDPTSHIGQDIEHMMELSVQETIDLELTFSTMMFPVIPPKYDFIAPKLHSHTLERIFHSGAFEKDVYNPLTKIDFLKNIRTVIERYAQIDFGIGYDTVEDYLNEKNYREQQLCKPFLGQLIEKGREYTEKVIQERQNPNFNFQSQFIGGTGYGVVQPIKTSNSIQLNQYLLQECPALQKFMKCMTEKVKFESIEKSGFFCWHGSSEEGIKNICLNGWDSSKRVDTAGDFFAAYPEMSIYYSSFRQSTHLILAYVLKGAEHINYAGEYVVQNPKKGECSYCLPLLIISFGTGRPVDFAGKALNSK